MRGVSLYAGVPGGRHLCNAGWGGDGGPEVLPGLRVLRAGLPVRVQVYPSGEACGRQVHALLSPDYQGTDNGVLRNLPDRGTPACGLEESERSDSRVSEDTQRAGAEAADGNRREGLLQRPRWIGAVETGTKGLAGDW